MREANVDEMWLYIALNLLIGMVHKPVLHSYWSKQHIISTPIFSRIMRRDRFKQITFPIQTFEEPDDDLKKLRFFFDNFQNNYVAEDHIAIDEYLLLWKGRLKFRIYIPKRERYGVKLYMMCKSLPHTSYLLPHQFPSFST